MSASGDDLWDALVRDLYLAALDADAAGRVPIGLRNILRADAVAVWSIDSKTGVAVDRMLTNMPQDIVEVYARKYFARQSWFPTVTADYPNVTLHKEDLRPERVTDKVFRPVRRRTDNDAIHVIGALMSLTPELATNIGVVLATRSTDTGRFGEDESRNLSKIRPHLQSALELRARYQALAAVDLHNAVPLDDILEAFSFVTMITDNRGMVLHANAAARQLEKKESGLVLNNASTWQVHSILIGEEARRLHVAAVGVANDGVRKALSMRLRSGTSALIVISRPPKGWEGLVKSQRPTALLTIRILGQDSLEMLQQSSVELFGFSAAEASVAVALSNGMSPKEIAEARAVQVSTIRTLLQRAQVKVGASNLRDLVGILSVLR